MKRLRSQANTAIPPAEAIRLWTWYGFAQIEDLILEDLAFAEGVVVIDDRLSAADAWLVRKADKGIIRVSDAISEPGRRRFAIAHELGHWYLHKNISQLVSCTNEDMVSRYKSSPPELEANYFAAELLMPKHLFRPALAASRPTAKFVGELASRFQTTRTSTAFRIADVSTDYFALVASVNGAIKWWQVSDALQDHIWIETGTSVPSYSAAAKYFSDEIVPQNPQRLDIDDWFSEVKDLYVASVFEDIIPIPSYGQVLSLLWLD